MEHPLYLRAIFMMALNLLEYGMGSLSSVRLEAVVRTFCGQASLAVFAFHAVDWFIPWQTMPLLLTLPVPWLFASIVRCGCDIGLVYVIKKA